MNVSINSNIIVNFIGRFWSVFATVIFIPLYIKILGVESYAIISFTLVLAAIMAVLDSGLSASLSREFSSANNYFRVKQKIFITLEALYFIISLITTIVLFLCSKLIAINWLKLDTININVSIVCIQILSFEVGLRLLSNFYLSGLLGLNLQVRSNIIQICYSILRNGLVLIPLYFNPSLELFFYWQLITTILYVLILRLMLFIAIKRRIVLFFLVPKIEKDVVSKVWKFAGGMMLISIVAAINSQLDKIALSALLPVESLGVYSLSFSLANGLVMVCSPVAMALLPLMIYSNKADSLQEVKDLFVKGQKFISALIFSSFSVLAIFSREILLVWTNDPRLSELAFPYLPWLALGATFLGLQVLPFNIAIANSYTRLNNLLGLISLVITIPGYLFLVDKFKGLGASWTFAVVQVLIGITYIFYINKKFLFVKFRYLFGHLIALPFFMSIILSILANQIFVLHKGRFLMFLEIAGIWIFVLLCNCLILFTRRMKSPNV